MRHIRYIPLVGTDAYTIVVTDDWNGQLEDHPSIVEHSEWFEIVDAPIPEKHQFLIYQSP
jgi:hypothetical protein